MNTQDLIKKVRKIEIKSKGLSNQLFSGEYHSKFKGKGMSFSEVREYAAGDDVRTIDWNVSARMGNTYVKVFEEERELTVILLIDISASGHFATDGQLKKDLITELAATLAFSANQNNDKIGVIFFTDIIEKFIPPKKGKTHVLRIIRELIEVEPKNKKTDIALALKYATNVIKKKSIGFIISDFMDSKFEDAIKITNKKHDLVALRIFDKHEQTLPNVGLVKVKDNESGAELWVDTSNKQVREQYALNASNHEKYLQNAFSKSGVDVAHINTSESYIKPLMNLFKRRA